MKTSVLLDLGWAVARIHKDAAHRKHLEWVDIFDPQGKYITIQRGDAVALAQLILDTYGSTNSGG